MRSSAAGGRTFAWRAGNQRNPSGSRRSPSARSVRQRAPAPANREEFSKMIRKNGVRKYGVLAVMAGLLTVGLSAAVVPAAVAGPKVPAAYSFRKIDNGGDRSFNQLLAINSSGRIAGYFGSGV